MIPFAGSDFWIADLGLEFLHWPKQRLVRKELRRGQSCDVLESTNPDPRPGGYRRVVSWLDIDTGGIVHADAYDANDRLLKQFDPKEFTKIKGEWQLEEMEIRNRQKGSKTRIDFKLGE
jgi:YD repeat-containing protein